MSPRTTAPAIADGCRERILKPHVSGLDDASEDSSFLDLRGYQVVGGGTIQSDVERTHVPLLYRPQHVPVRGRVTRVGAGVQCHQTPQYRHGTSRRDVDQPTPCGNTFTANAWRVTCVPNGKWGIACVCRNSIDPLKKGICLVGRNRCLSLTEPCRDPWLPLKSRSGTAHLSKAPSTSKTCRKSTCWTTRCFAWRKCCSVVDKRSRCVGKAGRQSTTVGFPNVAWSRYESSGSLDARPGVGTVGGPVWAYAECSSLAKRRGWE